MWKKNLADCPTSSSYYQVLILIGWKENFCRFHCLPGHALQWTGHYFKLSLLEEAYDPYPQTTSLRVTLLHSEMEAEMEARSVEKTFFVKNSCFLWEFYDTCIAWFHCKHIFSELSRFITCPAHHRSHKYIEVSVHATQTELRLEYETIYTHIHSILHRTVFTVLFFSF